jgi:hypothetical protein
LCETDAERVRCNGAGDHTQAPFICRYKQALFLHAGSVGLAEGIVPDSAGRQVADVRSEGNCLRRRGVKIEDYDMPGLKTDDGIADIGFAWMTLHTYLCTVW